MSVINACYACGTEGATVPVEVDGGHVLICEGECTWGEKEEETLTRDQFDSMMRVQVGESSDWLNSKDPIKVMHNC